MPVPDDLATPLGTSRPLNRPAYAALPFWREVLDRAARNAVQTVIPVLVAGTTGTVNGVDAVNLLWLVASAALVTILKAAAGIRASADAPLAWRLADRAIPAAAATLLGFLVVEGADVVAVVDWTGALVATASAAVLALAQAYVSPPARRQEDYARAA